MQRGQQAKMGGNMTFVRAVPNFLSQMAASSGGDAPDVGGIEGALKRHEQRRGGDDEREDREDNDDEAPIVVDSSEAMTSKERKKLDKMSGSLTFKGDDRSAAAKFKESAHARFMEEERKRKLAEAAASDEAEAAAAAASGKVVFRPGAAAEKKAGKRKHAGAEGSSKVGAKALKNTKLLSFAEDEDEES